MSESPGETRQGGAVRSGTAQDAPEPDENGDADPAPELPRSLTFRISRVTLLVIIVLAVCMTPVAWVQPWALSIYVIPLVLIVWVLRTRTVVTADSIATRMLRTTLIPWDEVRSFRLDQRRWLRAVLRDDAGAREVLLPAVRVRDLPRLAAMSGGRLPDFGGTTGPDDETPNGETPNEGNQDEQADAPDAERESGD